MYVNLIIRGLGAGFLAEISHFFGGRAVVVVVIIASVASAEEVHVVGVVASHRRGIGLREFPRTFEARVVEIVGTPARRRVVGPIIVVGTAGEHGGAAANQ